MNSRKKVAVGTFDHDILIENILNDAIGESSEVFHAEIVNEYERLNAKCDEVISKIHHRKKRKK